MKHLLIFLSLILMSGFVFADSPAKKPKTETVEIQTSAVCGHCEEKISNALTYTKGVVDFDFNDETKVVSVTYKTKKTSADDIRQATSAAGYQADEVPANQAAYDNLAPCCKKDGTK
ncbi:MAG: heavy metal-associated domain-containing protein [Bacteroidia bacterium]